MDFHLQLLGILLIGIGINVTCIPILKYLAEQVEIEFPQKASSLFLAALLGRVVNYSGALYFSISSPNLHLADSQMDRAGTLGICYWNGFCCRY